MPETAMDTHTVFKKLTEAGFEERQAEAVTDVMAQRSADAATKADVQAAVEAAELRLAHKITAAQLQSLAIVLPANAVIFTLILLAFRVV